MGLRRGFQCWIYFVQAGPKGPIKIGVTSGDPERRFQELQTSNHEALCCRALTHGLKAREKELHQMFAKHHIHGEWFSPHAEIINYMRSLPKVEGLDEWGATWFPGPNGGWKSRVKHLRGVRGMRRRSRRFRVGKVSYL